MQKISTSRTSANGILEGGKLTVGLDLGNRSSSYCVLNGAGQIVWEKKLATLREPLFQNRIGLVVLRADER
jgi:transposase